MPSPEISRRRAIQVLGLGTATLLSDPIHLLREPSISPLEPTPQKESESLPGIRVFGKFVVLKNVHGVKELVIENLWGTDELLYIKPTGPFTISLSPNGQRMAYGYQEFINGRAWSNAIVFRPDSVPITSRTTEYWVSGNGNPFNFVWSRDSKKLAFINGWGSSGKTTILGFSQDNVHPIELNGSLLGSFSPDNKWFARVLNNKLEIVGLDGNKRSVGNPDLERWTMSEFAWAPNSRQLAFFSSEKAVSEPYRGKSRLHLLNLDGGGVKVLTEISLPGLYPARLLFSPDGERVVFSLRPGERSLTPNTHVAIFNLQTRETAPIDTMELTDTPSVFGFLPPDLVIIEGVSRNREGNFRRRLLWVNISSGQVVKKQESPGALAHVSSRDLLFLDSPLSLSEPPSTRILYAPITNDPKIEGSLIGSTPGIVDLDSINTTATLATLRDGDQFEASGSSWFFFNNQRHELDPRIGPYIGAQQGELPEVFVHEIPEGEAIRFRPGDLLVDSRGQAWYLRNDKRYLVPKPNLLMHNIGLGQDRKHQNVPQEIIERIPEGKDPNEGKQAWFDWNGNLIETQPNGGEVFLFISGIRTNSQSHLETFKGAKSALISDGRRETQFLEATHNVEIGPQGEVRPRPYTEDDTNIYPPDGVPGISAQIKRYKEQLPFSIINLAAHSFGSFLGLLAMRDHTDAVRKGIFIDGPFKLIDRRAWGRFEDDLAILIGRRVGEYFTRTGKGTITDIDTEAIARQIQAEGSFVFTPSNENDLVIPIKSAVLEASNNELDGRKVKLVWKIGRFPPRNPSDFITAHGVILDNDDFLREFRYVLAPVTSIPDYRA